MPSTIVNESWPPERSENRPGGGVAPLPDVAGRRPLELGQQLGALESLGPERGGVLRPDRPLVGRRVHVRIEDPRVRMIEPRGLDPALEQGLGLAHEELVERVLARDQHREPVAAAPGPAPLLAQRGDGAGKAHRDRAVELADVDAELERIGRRDPEQLAVHQPPLDLAALRGRVAGAVRRQPGGGRGVDPVGGEAVDELGRLAALREADRAQAARDEPGHQQRRLGQRARPHPELGVEQGRIPEHDVALRAGRRVRVDHRRLPAGQRQGELAGVGDRRRREQELRLGAVRPGQALQPPEHVPDVRSEDAAVDVRLVDDDVAQVVEHVSPAVVVREDADVEHVGVRQDHVRGLADLRPPLGLGVAVVDRGANPAEAQPGETPRLVLGQRLRRVEVQRPRGRLPRDRVEHGEVEGERLPRRGCRRDDHVLTSRGRLPGLALLRVEAVDAARGEGRCDARVEVGGKRLEAGVAWRLARAGGELLAEEQVVPGTRQRVRPRRYGAKVRSYLLLP